MFDNNFKICSPLRYQWIREIKEKSGENIFDKKVREIQEKLLKSEKNETIITDV